MAGVTFDRGTIDADLLKQIPRERLAHVTAMIFCRQIPLQACEAIAIEGFKTFFREAKRTEVVRLSKEEWRYVFDKVVQYVQFANQDRVLVKS